MGWTEWLSLLDHGKEKKGGGDRCDDRSADSIASSSQGFECEVRVRRLHRRRKEGEGKAGRREEGEGELIAEPD